MTDCRPNRIARLANTEAWIIVYGKEVHLAGELPVVEPGKQPVVKDKPSWPGRSEYLKLLAIELYDRIADEAIVSASTSP